MKAMVISYSHTGNNRDLASSLAAALGAEHVQVTETKRRSMGTIVGDLMLNRTPAVSFSAQGIEEYDLVLFVAPVWMGHVATPLRACFRQLGPKLNRYAYISICGGADGPNPKLADELTKRLAKEPALVLDLHIADLLPAEPKPTRDDTSSYRISHSDVRQLTATAVTSVQKLYGEVSN